MAVTILVLQTFAVQCGAPCGTADKETACAHIARSPSQIAGTLEAEHRVIDIKRNHRHAVVGVRSCRSDPISHTTGFVNAFLQNLSGCGFFVEHQLVGILRRVQLTHLREDTELAEHAFHAKSARLIRHDRHDLFADVFVFEQDAEQTHKGHGGRELALFTGFQHRIEGIQSGNFQRLCHRLARGKSAHRRAAFAQIFHLLAVFGRTHKRQIGQLLVSDRNIKTVTEFTQSFFAHLLLLVRRILRFTRLAHTVTFHSLGENDGRFSTVFIGYRVSREHLERVVTAAIQTPDFVVRHIGNQFQQLGIFAEEMLTHISAVFGFVGLVFAVNDFFHALQQQAALVFCQQAIPTASPDDLDDVPARTTEYTFKFLNNLAVAPHRAVQTLQVTVNNKDQVVQLFASGHRNSAQRFRFIGLAVTQKGPHLATIRLRKSTVLQIAHEARLINCHQRAESHRHSGELPKVGH